MSSSIEQKSQAAFMCVSFIIHRAKVSSSIHVCPSMFSEKRATAATGATERQQQEQQNGSNRSHGNEQKPEAAATGATEEQSQKSKAGDKKSHRTAASRAKPAIKRATTATRATERQRQESRKTSKAHVRRALASGDKRRCRSNSCEANLVVPVFVRDKTIYCIDHCSQEQDPTMSRCMAAVFTAPKCF